MWLVPNFDSTEIYQIPINFYHSSVLEVIKPTEMDIGTEQHRIGVGTMLTTGPYLTRLVLRHVSSKMLKHTVCYVNFQ